MVKNLSNFEPRLLRDWDYKNNDADPEKIKPFSKKRINWICHLDNRHKWTATLANRVGLYQRKGQYNKKRNVGCPFCNPSSTANPWEENNLLYKIKKEMPDLIKYWHEKNKISPEKITPGTEKEYWWKCRVCLKPFKSRPRELLRSGKRRKRYCKSCGRKEAGKSYVRFQISKNGSLLDKLPSVIKFWDFKKNKLLPEKVSYMAHKKAWFKCEFGHKPYKSYIYNFYAGTRCPKCYIKTSIAEIRLYTELINIFPKKVFWQKKIKRKEADIFLSNYNLIIEIDGYPWHLNREKKDAEKSIFFTKLGYKVLRIRDPKLPKISGNIILSTLTDYKYREFKKLLIFLNKLQFNKQISKLLKLNSYSRERDFKKIFAELPKPPRIKSLASTHPKISKEFDLIKNKPLTPEHFSFGSKKKVWWICKKNHSWNTNIYDRTRKKSIDVNGRIKKATGCPKCYRENL